MGELRQRHRGLRPSATSKTHKPREPLQVDVSPLDQLVFMKNNSLTIFLEIHGRLQEETQRGSAPAPRRFFRKTPKSRDFLKQPLASRNEKTSRNFF